MGKKAGKAKAEPKAEAKAKAEEAGPKAKAKGKAKAAAQASTSAATLAAPAGWEALLEEMAPEERAREEEKQRQRNEKAQKAAADQKRENERRAWYEQEQKKQERKKHAEDAKWERQLENVKQKAVKEGSIIIAEWSDETQSFWGKLDNKTWIEAQGPYYCRLCEKNLNDNTLEAHINSELHKKRSGNWASPAAGPAPPPAAKPQQARPSQSSASWSGALEDWQEAGPDGSVRCMLCSKLCDGLHETTDGHMSRLEHWRHQQSLQSKGYPEPKEPYLAWVPYDGVSGERGCKCLLCGKWCNDEWSHSGTRENPQGSKEHQKNLRNYGPGDAWWQTRVAAERLKWHPKQATKFNATPAPWANNALDSVPAGATCPPCVSSGYGSSGQPRVAVSSANASAPASVARELPAGWTAVQGDAGNTYYYHADSKIAQWSFPSDADGAENPQLPEGWTAHKDKTGTPFYHHAASDTTQWDIPG